jgi:hypothetical protein
LKMAQTQPSSSGPSILNRASCSGPSLLPAIRFLRSRLARLSRRALRCTRERVGILI